MITFRPHTRNDIALRVKWLNNKSANRFIGDKDDYHTDTEQESAWFDGYETTDTKRFFTICVDEIPVGIVGLTKIDWPNYTTELFIIIGEDDYRGKGIGKVALKYIIDIADKELHLRNILLFVNKDNRHALHVYQSLGFIETKRAEMLAAMMLPLSS